jgi:membrane protein YqaA with SNARE-associated domain
VLIDLASYLGLFSAAFLAATLVPAQSEALLVGLVMTDRHPIAALLAVATIGNVAGSLVNYLLGRFIERFRRKPWFPVSPASLEKASGWYRRYGLWSLLLSWMPVIGDPITLVAGVLRTPVLPFLVLVTIAKFGRYAVLAAVTLGLM